MDVILDRGSTPLTSRKKRGSHEPLFFLEVRFMRPLALSSGIKLLRFALALATAPS